MKKFKTHTFFKNLVLVFSIAFLLGSFTNVLLIPRYTSLYSKVISAPGTVNILTRHTNFHTINFLEIFDNSTFDSDQLDTLRFLPKCFMILFIGFGFYQVKSRSIQSQSNIFYNNQHSYLSYCTLRIWCEKYKRVYIRAGNQY